MEVRILDARERHLEALERLEKTCFSLPSTFEMLRRQLCDPMVTLLAAEDESGRFLGSVGMTAVLDEGYIGNVAVDPDVRRQGIGDRLVEALLERADEKKLRFVTLEVRESNEAAIGLYAKHGFLPVGRQKNYYGRPREDAILMTKELK